MRLNGYKRLWKLLPLTAVVFLLATLASCTGEEDIVRQTGDGDALVTLSLRLPGASLPASRALDETTDENRVDEIDVLVFNPGGNFAYSAQGTNISGGGATKTFTVKLRVGSYDLVILANARDIVEAATLTGKTKATALAALTAAVPSGGKWLADASEAEFRPFPMWGNKVDAAIQENMSIKDIQLLRMMARVDVEVADNVSNFTLTSVHVYNYNTHGTVAPGSELDNGAVTTPTVPTVSTLTEGPVLYDEIDSDNNQCVREIYIMEAKNHKDNGDVKALLDRTCLVIGGKYGTDPDQKATYYRVDFSEGSGPSQKYLDVLRNHKYAINITKVSGPGYETEDIAFRSAPVNIEAGVTKWNEAQGGSVYFDQQYYLSVTPKTVFEFAKSGDSQTVTITTDVPDGWKIAKITEADGTTTNSGWLTTDIAAGDSGKRTSLNIIVANNSSIEERTGYIYIRAGRIEAKLTVTQNGIVFAGSNIVWMNGKLTFSTGADDPSVDVRSQGVFFKWGSLLAITPVAGTPIESAILYCPFEPPVYASLANVPYADGKTTTGTDSSEFSDDVMSDDDFADYNGGLGYNADIGVGDICRYISDQNWVKGRWRLPTGEELRLLVESSGITSQDEHTDDYYYGQPEGDFVEVTGTDANGLLSIPSYLKLGGQSFHCGGYIRGASKLTLNYPGTAGYYMTGSSRGAGFFYLMSTHWNGASVLRSKINRQYAFAARCVRE